EVGDIADIRKRSAPNFGLHFAIVARAVGSFHGPQITDPGLSELGMHFIVEPFSFISDTQHDGLQKWNSFLKNLGIRNASWLVENLLSPLDQFRGNPGIDLAGFCVPPDICDFGIFL